MNGNGTQCRLGAHALKISITEGNPVKPEIIPIVVVGSGGLEEGDLLVPQSWPWRRRNAWQMVKVVPRPFQPTYAQVTRKAEYENT